MMLFTPITIGTLSVKNRIVLAPMDTELNAITGEITDRMIAYYTERAAGGVGLIITEFTAVDAVQRLTSPGIYSDRLIAGWERLTDQVHAYGAKIILQIAHHGGRAISRITGVKPVAPSAIESPLYQEVPKALSVSEIKKIIDSFVKAAERAKLAGFDGVEIHAGHGYLIGEFISPHTNKRDDAFGGEFEKRMRVPTQILAGIRDVTREGFVVGFKFSAYESLEDGIDITLGKRIAVFMRDQGVNYLHVSVLSFPLQEEQYFSVPPVYVSRPPLVKLATQVKKEVSDIPIIAVGGISTREEAENVLKTGAADLVAIGRALIADPQLPAKWKNDEPTRPCIRCNKCHSRIMAQKTLHCAVNPMVGREGEVTPPPSYQKRIVVVGGGPAGIIAAVTASKRGHEVHLLESRDTLGGKLIAGSLPKFKQPLRRLLVWLNRLVMSSTVHVHLGKVATPGRVLEYAPNHVILATGGQPRPLPALKGAIDPIAAFERAPKLGNRIIIVGAGMVGCELACYLDDLGKEVILADVLTEEQLMSGEHFFNRLVLLQMVRKRVTQLCLGTPLAFELEGVRCGTKRINVDAIVNATGFIPNTALIQSYTRVFDPDEVSLVGDEHVPSNIYAAVQNAFLVARAL